MEYNAPVVPVTALDIAGSSRLENGWIAVWGTRRPGESIRVDIYADKKFGTLVEAIRDIKIESDYEDDGSIDGELLVGLLNNYVRELEARFNEGAKA